MDAVEETGITYRETLQGLLKRAKKPERRKDLEADLLEPPAPASITYLLHMFFRLRRRKGASGFGMPPLEWPDLDAFARMTRQYISPWEIGVIETLDDLYLAEKAKTRQP